MTFYNLLFGKNYFSTILLKILGLTEADVPRFRDCYLCDNEIVIYTRTGGGNRDYYESEEVCRENYPEYFKDSCHLPNGPWNQDLRDNPNFLSDEDDDFDRTYAYFRFSCPEDYKKDIEAIAEKDQSYTPSEKWNNLLKELYQNKDKVL